MARRSPCFERLQFNNDSSDIRATDILATMSDWLAPKHITSFAVENLYGPISFRIADPIIG